MLILLLSMSGCSLAPEYERPQIPESQGAWPDYSNGEGSASTQGVAADVGWREFFSDPRMQLIIEKALRNNRDLRIAAHNVEAAQARYRVQRAEIAPHIGAAAAGSLQNLPPSVAPGDDKSRSTTEVYSVGLGVTAWEVDLWGRLRSLSDAALQSYLAVEENRTSVQISLIAEVVNAYLAWLADLETISITRDTLQSQRESYEMQQRSLDGGIGTELDVTQAKSSVYAAEVNLAQNLRREAEDFNLLVLLVGEPIDAATKATLAQGQPLLQEPRALPDVPAGLPADLLTRRPDIRASEHSLMAANANIGAARTAFFPTVRLTGAVGTTSDGLSGLFASGSDFWAFSPQIILPIFDAGSNEANLDLAEARRRIEIAQYERSIQSAFREVADALASRAHLMGELEAQQRLVKVNQETFDLYTVRFEGGLDSYFNALIWQRLLYDAQRDLVNVRFRQLANRVELYKVLGGGWREHTEQAAHGDAPVNPRAGGIGEGAQIADTAATTPG